MAILTMYNLSASIGVSATSATPPVWTYADLDAGIDNFSESLNEVVQQYQFMGGGGFASNHVTGMAPAVTCTGKRVIGDAAQDYIMGKKYSVGADRESSFMLEWTEGSADKSLTVPCTICNIQEWSGASTDDSAISFEIRFNGQPTVA